MPEYSPHPYPVGNQASPFLTNQAPVTGTIGPNPLTWTVRSGYVAPYRSFYQNLNNATYNLGPYCRMVSPQKGLSGRLVLDGGTDWGFAQQCWYDFPRGALEQAYPENYEWWGETEKVTIAVLNLLSVTVGDYCLVEVAIGFYGSDAPEKYGPVPRAGLFIKRGLNSIAFAIWGGDCGESDVPKFSTPTLGPNKPAVPWLPFPYLPPSLIIPPPLWNWLTGNGGGGGGNGNEGSQGGGAGDPNGPPMDNDSPWETIAGAAFGGGGFGDTSDGNRDGTTNNWMTEREGLFGDFMDKLSDVFQDVSGLTDEQLDNLKRNSGELLLGIHEATDLFVKGWLVPNLLEAAQHAFPDLNIDVKGLSEDSPWEWRPNEYTQQRFAEHLASSLDRTDFTHIDGIPRRSPRNSDGNVSDPMWFLTMLNRGENTPSPYVDTGTNELVIPEKYGFNRGGSVETAEPFLKAVDASLGTDVGDALGTFLDMSPLNAVFVVSVLPIATLETLARARKTALGETINPVSNLDTYRNTDFDLRISAENLKKGNPDLYANLVNEGLLREE